MISKEGKYENSYIFYPISYNFMFQKLTVTESKIEPNPQELLHKIDIIDKKKIPTLKSPNKTLLELIKYLPINFIRLGPKYNSWLLVGLTIDSFVNPVSLDFIYLDRIKVHRGLASDYIKLRK